MDPEEICGCGGHGHHHGEQNSERQEVRSEDCGCGHGHHGQHGYSMSRGWHHESCNCGCRQHHGGMRFHRRFISQEEIMTRLEDYLKQLQAEAKGVEERIEELKQGKESK
jgi:hypothetical protein